MLRRAFAPLWLAALVLHVGTSSSSLHAQASPPSRIAAATALADASYTEWLGPGPAPLAINTGPAWFDQPGAMHLESYVAYENARARFGHLSIADNVIAEGIAWYLQSRVVERAFNNAFRRPGYRFYTACSFGCHMPWVVPPLVASRWSDGLGRAEFLRQHSGRAWPPLDRRWPASEFDPRTVRVALALGSLERELGWPALQGALRAAASDIGDRPVIDVLADATARDLGRVFAIALGEPTDYAVGEVTSAAAATCGTLPCYVTRVAMSRRGEVPYPLTLRVEFADTTHVAARWTGAETVLEFESAAAVSRVRLDPDRTWLLDANHANGEYVRDRSGTVSVVKWMAGWMLWLQGAMLTYTVAI